MFKKLGSYVEEKEIYDYHIGSLLRVLISKGHDEHNSITPYKTQNKLIDDIANKFPEKENLSVENLNRKFSSANKFFKNNNL